MDKYFRVEVLASTPNSQQLVYAAMHQDYDEGFVFDEELPEESKAGDLIVKHLLSGHKGHFGPLEHPQITFNCGWFPHSVMQQARTHRIGISFDVQSFRYTGKRLYSYGKRLGEICTLFSGVEEKLFCDLPVDSEGYILDSPWQTELEQLIYLRPVGSYTDREGKKYEYTNNWRQSDLCVAGEACIKYSEDIDRGKSEEHARGLIPFDVRQHWVVSLNLRSLMHLLQIRCKKDAQLEIQQMCDLTLPHFQVWCPEVYEWFMGSLWLKGRLAP